MAGSGEGPTTGDIRAIIFDAYGTLLDVIAIATELDRRWPGRGVAIAEHWRGKQIEYALLRTMGERHADFATVTRDALLFVADRLDLDAAPHDIDLLMHAYERLPAHPEVAETLEAIRALGLPMAVLSNGTPDMLESALGHAGIDHLFDAILSIEAVQAFKPTPDVYRLGTDRFGLAADRMLFVSSNGWDIAGAGWFGYRCFWINRAGLPVERLSFQPHHAGRSLADVADLLAAGRA